MSDEQLTPYLEGWVAILALMRQGRTFSGHERNCAFLNCGTGRVTAGRPVDDQADSRPLRIEDRKPRINPFANVSACSGLDFPDDGRGAALVDWDHDGDLDLWLSNRTGPRLRLMVNQTAGTGSGSRGVGKFVAFYLRGTTCNRDAIGARVEVTLDDEASDGGRRGSDGAGQQPSVDRSGHRRSTSTGRKLIQTLHAGDAFVSQSSKWLHFGLGPQPRIRGVAVRWPGGEVETFKGVEPGRFYVLEQGRGEARPRQRPGPGFSRSALKPSNQVVPTLPGTSQILLPAHVQMPQLEYRRFEGDTRRIETGSGPLLVNLWASWCLPCVAELKGLTRHARRLRAAGLQVLCLTVDGVDPGQPTGPDDARRVLEQIGFPFQTGIVTSELLEKIDLMLGYLFDRQPPLVVPLSLLLDREGRLAAIYRGPLEVGRLLRDVGSLDSPPRVLRKMAAPFGGRRIFDAGDVRYRELAKRFEGRFDEDQIRYLQLAAERMAAVDTDGLSETQRRSYRVARAEIHVDMAWALRSMGRMQEAEIHFRQAVRFQPDHATTITSLAATLAQSGQVSEAIEELNQSLRVEPSAVTHFILATLMQHESRPEQAIHHYTEALRLGADDFEVQVHGRLAELLIARGEYEQAIAHQRRVVETYPDHNTALVNLGVALAATGRIDEAIRHFHMVLQRDPDEYNAHYNLGSALRLQGKPTEALTHYRHAVRIQPDSVKALYRLSWVLATHADGGARRPKEAMRIAQRAAELTDHQQPLMLDALAAAHAADGQFDKAVTLAEKAATLARQMEATQIVDSIDARLELYRGGKPYVEQRMSGRESPRRKGDTEKRGPS